MQNEDIPWWAVAIPGLSIPILASKGVTGIGSTITSGMVDSQRQNFDRQRSYNLNQLHKLEELEAAAHGSEAALSQIQAV